MAETLVSSSAVTCLDGYAMARNGRAGLALATAALASFIGGTFGTILLALMAAPLAAMASRIEAADYTALMICGLAAAIVITQGAVHKAVVMTLLGFALAAIGTDPVTAEVRFTFGRPELVDGLGFMPIAIGLFGFAEIISQLTRPEDRQPTSMPLDYPWPEAGETRRATIATLRGTAVGSALGILPGAGPVIASLASYALEKKCARVATFGSGAIEGVAGPESANNAAAQTSFVPLLTLGFPSGPVGALLLGALIVHGIQPGPTVVTREPALFWGLVVSMWIGNVILLAINLPLVGWWGRLIRVPYAFLYPTTIALSCTGLYALNHSTFDLGIAAAFGIAGYLLKQRGFEPAPLLLAFVLTPLLRDNLNRALLFADGDLTTFATHPLSALLLTTAAAALLSTAWSEVKDQRRRLRMP